MSSKTYDVQYINHVQIPLQIVSAASTVYFSDQPLQACKKIVMKSSFQKHNNAEYNMRIKLQTFLSKVVLCNTYLPLQTMHIFQSSPRVQFHVRRLRQTEVRYNLVVQSSRSVITEITSCKIVYSNYFSLNLPLDELFKV